jgi:hypothetical protein
MRSLVLLLACALAALAADPDWNKVNEETLRRYRTLI